MPTRHDINCDAQNLVPGMLAAIAQPEDLLSGIRGRPYSARLHQLHLLLEFLSLL